MLRPGITLKQAEKLLRSKLRTSEDRPLEAFCDFVYPSRGHDGLSLMIQNGVVTHIEAHKSGVLTKSGAGVGDSTAKLKRLFGKALEIEQHKYDDSGFYYYVWEKNRRRGVKFEIGGDRVVAIYAGSETIMLVEGCS